MKTQSRNLSPIETAMALIRAAKQSAKFGRLKFERDQIRSISGRKRLEESILDEIATELDHRGYYLLKGTGSIYLLINPTLASKTWPVAKI
jgi:hypothetical protein